MPGLTFDFRGETDTLDAAARVALPGSFIELPDGVVHYELDGPTNGQIVVLVPGVSAPYTTWDRNFGALIEAGLCVLRFDLFGRGYSDRPEVVYDLDLFDRQIVHLLAALKLDGMVTLAGLSMGGAIVTTFASRYPERVRRLILIDPLVFRPLSLPLRLMLAPGIGERVFNWFGDRILVGGQAQDFYNPEFAPEFQAKYRMAIKYRGFKRAILSTIRTISTWHIAEAYEQVGKANYPVLLFWGRQDKTVPFETHQRVQSFIPRAEFHAIDNAGHTPHYEQPEMVNLWMIEFLTRK